MPAFFENFDRRSDSIGVRAAHHGTVWPTGVRSCR
jgi:hypothetical protein